MGVGFSKWLRLKNFLIIIKNKHKIGTEKSENFVIFTYIQILRCVFLLFRLISADQVKIKCSNLDQLFLHAFETRIDDIKLTFWHASMLLKFDKKQKKEGLVSTILNFNNVFCEHRKFSTGREEVVYSYSRTCITRVCIIRDADNWRCASMKYS